MPTCPRGYWRSSAPARVIGMDRPGDGLDGVPVNSRDPGSAARARLQEARRREDRERQNEAARDGLGPLSPRRATLPSGDGRSC